MKDIRSLTRRALEQIKKRFPDSLIRCEMGLLNHLVRADVAALNDGLTLFELKSEADTLRRLPAQVETYSAVADWCVLVVDETHYTKAAEVVPEWWGIWVDTSEHGMCFPRIGISNPTPHKPSIARLLWDNEVREEMRALGMKPGKLRHKEKCAALAERMSLAELRHVVFKRLRDRHPFRFASQWVAAAEVSP